MNFSKKSKIIIFTTFAVLFIFYGAFFSIGHLFSRYFPSENIEKLLNSNTNLTFNLEGFKLYSTKDLCFKIFLKNLKISTPDTKKEILKLEDTSFKIGVFPLIFKKLSLKQIDLKSVYLDVLLEKNGHFEIEKYINKEFKPDFKVIFSKTNINISNYSIKFDDEPHNIIHKIEGKNFTSNKLSNKKINGKSEIDIYSNNQKTNISFDVNMKLPLLKHIDDKDFKADLKAENINLNAFYPYLNQFGIKKANGVINLDVSTIREENKNKISLSSNLDKLYLENNKSTIKNDDLMVIKTNAVFDNKDVSYENFKLYSNGIDINSNGKIKNYISKNPKVDLNMDFKDCELNNLISLLPDEIETEDISIKNLKKYNSHAKINGSLNILGNILEPDITGKLDFKDVYVIKLDKRIPFAYGEAEFLKKLVRVNIKAFARKDEEVDVTGDFELFGKKNGNFRITSSERVNLEVARPILYAVRDVLDFVLGPLPIMDIKGVGSIDILVNGTKENATINGWFKFNNTSATIEGLNSWIKNGQGTLFFEGEKMRFDNWSADILGNPLTINGSATTLGDVDINFTLNKARFNDLILVGSKTDFAEKLKEYIPSNSSGYADFKVNLKGKNLKKNFNKETILNELKPSGHIKFYNCGFNFLKNVLVKNLNGDVEYGEKTHIDVNAFLRNSKILANGDLKLKANKSADVNLNLSSNGLHSLDIFETLFGNKIKNNFINNLKFSLLGDVNIKGEIPFDISKIDFEKLNLNGEIKGLNEKNDNLKFSQGSIILRGKDAFFKDLNIDYLNSKFKINGTTSVLAKKPKPNLKIHVYDLRFYTVLESLKLLNSPSLNKLLSDYTDPQGFLKGYFEVHNDNFKGKIEPNGLSLYSLSKKAPFVLKSGDIEFSNKNLKLKAFNFNLGDLPFFVDTTISNFMTKTPVFSGKFSTILDEKGADKFINSMLTYPVKVQGEIGVKGKISGYTNKYNVNSTLTLNPDSDISYMGANIGDIDSKREVTANISFEGNLAKIHKIELSKFISSQNNKTYPLNMIRMSGNISKNAKNFTLNPLVVKTLNPVNAKFFNVLFKKSILKQGLFNCDLKMTGDIDNPKVTGNLDLKDINIPLYDLKILNADVKLNNENIIASLEGKSLDSDVSVKLSAKNKATLPVIIHKIDINSKVVNLTSFIEKITETVQNKGFELNKESKIPLSQDSFIIEKGNVSAKEVKFNNISAENFSSEFSQNNDGILKIKDMTVDIAGGKVISNGEISLDKASVKMNSEIKNCDANTLATQFFGAQNQIYGAMNGKISFSGSKLYLKEGINTIKSKVQFEILNGKMPKLGSLEYLLRAANIYKSGLLNMSLNSIIELIIPYQTGEFESIKGSLEVQEGLVKDIEIYSKGKSLSLFLEGSYNINTSNADIIIFGRLAKNVSNVLGFVGSTSFNSLINMFSGKKFKVLESDAIQAVNKIPLIEINADDFRIFTARIIGDINKDNYVKSFNWLN